MFRISSVTITITEASIADPGIKTSQHHALAPKQSIPCLLLDYMRVSANTKQLVLLRTGPVQTATLRQAKSLVQYPACASVHHISCGLPGTTRTIHEGPNTPLRGERAPPADDVDPPSSTALVVLQTIQGRAAMLQEEDNRQGSGDKGQGPVTGTA